MSSNYTQVLTICFNINLFLIYKYKYTKIFIVLYWFWEGDGYLVNEYKDCFLTEEESISFANTLTPIFGGKTIKIYLPGNTIPDESDGDYGTPAFAQIIEKVF